MKQTILILSGGKIYGPFPDQETATAWNAAHAPSKASSEMYSFWETGMGTAEVAHECGTRLLEIGEASNLRNARKATGA